MDDVQAVELLRGLDLYFKTERDAPDPKTLRVDELAGDLIDSIPRAMLPVGLHPGLCTDALTGARGLRT